MLQQTRVEVVRPYSERFLRRFPDAAALARAPLADVLQEWAGLGYYRRARHLHAAAQHVVAHHAGRVPSAPGELEALPGIGRYTAGAIRSIAFDQPAPILDGNVARVFARWYGIATAVEAAATRTRMWRIAAAWAADPSPGDINQALMELGATTCTAAAPVCTRCPLRRGCVARSTGRTAALPRTRRRPPARRVPLVAALVRRGDRILFVQRRSGTLLESFWELPTSRLPMAMLAARIQDRCGIEIASPRMLGRVRHTILANTLDVHVVETEVARRQAKPRSAMPRRGRGAARLANLELPDLAVKWMRETVAAQHPLTTLARKALRLAQRRADSSAVRASVRASRYLTMTGA
jgi:A/G-specific adenine glycosylase